MFVEKIITQDNFSSILESKLDSDLLLYALYNTEESIRFITFPNVLFLYNIRNKKEYIFVFNHSEFESLEFSYLKKLISFLNKTEHTIYSINSKAHRKILNLKNLIDIEYHLYFNSNESINQTDFQTQCSILFSKNKSYYTPLVKLSEEFNVFRESATQIISENYLSEYNKHIKKTIEVFSKIELSGITVDRNLFTPSEKIINDKIFPEYHILTNTFRPLPSQGHFPISNIAKSSVIRKSFCSEFGTDGLLFEFDYNAYHVYLIAELIKYKFTEHPYIYFGKLFFEKEEITIEEYNIIKRLVFRLLYGIESIDHEFFNKTTKLADELYKAYKQNGYIISKLFRRRIKVQADITEKTKHKLLSYYIQSFETERNINMMDKIQTLLKTKQSKLIIYNYDSLVFDIVKTETDLIPQIKSIMESDSYKVKIKYGKNYKNLKEY